MAGWNNTIKVNGNQCSIIKTLYMHGESRSVHIVRAPEPYEYECELKDRVDADRLIVVKQVLLNSAVYEGKAWEEKVAMLERLTELKHGNVLKYFGLTPEEGITLSTDKKFSIQMEYCAHTDLKTYIKSKKIRLTENFVLSVAESVLLGLTYLHNLKPTAVIHTDLKATNVFVAVGGMLRIGDMDDCASKNTDVSRSTQSIRMHGTPLHMSPEMCGVHLHGKPAKVSRRTDVWSFGCMMVDIITSGKLRYVNNSGSMTDGDSITHMQSVYDRRSRPDFSEVPSFYHQWLARSLESDVEKRFCSGCLLDLIEYPHREVSTHVVPCKIRLEHLKEYVGIDFGSSRVGISVTRHDGTEDYWYDRTHRKERYLEPDWERCHLVDSEGESTVGRDNFLYALDVWGYHVNFKLFDGADYQKAATLAQYYHLCYTVTKNELQTPNWNFSFPSAKFHDPLTLASACQYLLEDAMWDYNTANFKKVTFCVITGLPKCLYSTEGIIFDSTPLGDPITSVVVANAFCSLLLQSSLWSCTKNRSCKDIFVVDMGASRKPVKLFLRQKNVRVDQELLRNPYRGPWTSGTDALHSLSKSFAPYNSDKSEQCKARTECLIDTYFATLDFKDFVVATKDFCLCSRCENPFSLCDCESKSDIGMIFLDNLCKLGREMGRHICMEVMHIMTVCISMNYHITDYCILVTGRASHLPEVQSAIQSQFMEHVVYCDKKTESPLRGAALCGQLLRDTAEKERPGLIKQLQDSQLNILYNRGRLLVVNEVTNSPLENLRQLVSPKPTVIPELWHICNSRNPNLALVCRRGSSSVWLEEINVDNDDHKWQMCRTVDSPDNEFALFNFGTQKWLEFSDTTNGGLVLNSPDDADHSWKLVKDPKDDSKPCLLCTKDLTRVVDTTLAYSVPNTTTPLKSKEWPIKERKVPKEFAWRLVEAY